MVGRPRAVALVYASGMHPTIAGRGAGAGHRRAPAPARRPSPERPAWAGCSGATCRPGRARRRAGGVVARCRPTSVSSRPSTPGARYAGGAAVRAGQRRRGAGRRRALARADLARSRSAWSLGLVVGKALGVSLVAGGAVQAGAGHLPEGMRASHLVSASALAGIGFTVSLFVAELAFESEALRDEAKVGVLAASALAAALGWALFRTVDARAPDEPATGDHGWSRPRTPAPTTSAARRVRRTRWSSSATTRVRTPAPPSLRWRGCASRSATTCGVVFRHLPLEDAHPDAPLAAEAAEAAGAQGRFWEMHDRLLADTRHPPGAPSWSPTPRHSDLDVDRFSERPALPRARPGGGRRRGQRPPQRRARHAGVLPGRRAHRRAAELRRPLTRYARPMCRISPAAWAKACKTQESRQRADRVLASVVAPLAFSESEV